ncbi:TIGR02530 family flagellar biosynthesis protein [Clostridium fallax]|uniref:Flagellar operon protein n=1 Tax=Clostridium fallax TaxID=1533 RepID=A0A1M4UJL3_9CLOT|nr:TIGR02530 family flagellar biosynthesis protein [Clostridium fallax]SHE56887.1 flagellar operon protein [Clostridium fallax]SQB07600.1 flagellar operon protein [Clostridium fallax]
MSYRIINGKPYLVGSFGQVNDNSTNKIEKNNGKKQNSFKEVLDTTLKNDKSFTISNHASERLKNIDFTDKDYKEIEKGFAIAYEKGAKNTLMLYKDVALIASVKNKTIITAIDKDRTKDNVFTNIDSVVIL